MSSSDTERNYLYLITEHENEDFIGAVKSTQKPLVKREKNEETTIHTFDEETGDFREKGKQVGLGYVDLPTDVDESEASAAMKRKLGEVDESWLRKAGLDPEEVLLS